MARSVVRGAVCASNPAVTNMSERPTADTPALDDHGLVALVQAALVDPNLHTDTRMRLHGQIVELARGAHEELHGQEGTREALARHGDHVPDLLRAVLVDPSLHTDTRMRLHREIGELLSKATPAAGAPSPGR